MSTRRAIRSLGLFGLISTLLVLAAPSAFAAPPFTLTETEHNVVETFPDPEGICGITGQVTLNSNTVFHVTAFDDGRVHVTGTFTGSVQIVGDNGVTYTGHYTQWFGENANSRNANGTFTFTVQLRGDDGSRVKFNVVAHFAVNANGEVTSEFEKAICH